MAGASASHRVSMLPSGVKGKLGLVSCQCGPGAPGTPRVPAWPVMPLPAFVPVMGRGSGGTLAGIGQRVSQAPGCHCPDLLENNSWL